MTRQPGYLRLRSDKPSSRGRAARRRPLPSRSRPWRASPGPRQPSCRRLLAAPTQKTQSSPRRPPGRWARSAGARGQNRRRRPLRLRPSSSSRDATRPRCQRPTARQMCERTTTPSSRSTCHIRRRRRRLSLASVSSLEGRRDRCRHSRTTGSFRRRPRSRARVG